MSDDGIGTNYELPYCKVKRPRYNRVRQDLNGHVKNKMEWIIDRSIDKDWNRLDFIVDRSAYNPVHFIFNMGI